MPILKYPSDGYFFKNPVRRLLKIVTPNDIFCQSERLHDSRLGTHIINYLLFLQSVYISQRLQFFPDFGIQYHFRRAGWVHT